MVAKPIGHLIGANLELVDTKPRVAVGTTVELEKGGEAVYLKASAAFAGEGYVGVVAPDLTIAPASLTTTATAFGARVAVAQAPVGVNEYGWFVWKGESNVQVAASCAANVAINSTATAGQLDDDGTAGSEVIEGIVLQAARAASAGLALATIVDTRVGATKA
jgi:hypothetical protein